MSGNIEKFTAQGKFRQTWNTQVTRRIRPVFSTKKFDSIAYAKETIVRKILQTKNQETQGSYVNQLIANIALDEKTAARLIVSGKIILGYDRDRLEDMINNSAAAFECLLNASVPKSVEYRFCELIDSPTDASFLLVGDKIKSIDSKSILFSKLSNESLTGEALGLFEKNKDSEDLYAIRKFIRAEFKIRPEFRNSLPLGVEAYLILKDHLLRNSDETPENVAELFGLKPSSSHKSVEEFISEKCFDALNGTKPQADSEENQTGNHGRIRTHKILIAGMSVGNPNEVKGRAEKLLRKHELNGMDGKIIFDHDSVVKLVALAHPGVNPDQFNIVEMFAAIFEGKPGTKI